MATDGSPLIKVVLVNRSTPELCVATAKRFLINGLQVVEALMCMYPDEIKSKRVTIGDPPAYTEVSGDTQCRSCSREGGEARLRRIMLKRQCIVSSDDCRACHIACQGNSGGGPATRTSVWCSDDKSEFFFKNGAVLHYTFESTAIPKSLTVARNGHGMKPLSFYDAVFVNEGNGGNGKKIKADEAIQTAIDVQDAGTAFFWLSTYTGGGTMSKWSKDQATRFSASGARYVDIQSMAKGMEAWTKGAVESKTDEHYCLPGPPDEIGILLLKIVWAVYEEGKDT